MNPMLINFQPLPWLHSSSHLPIFSSSVTPVVSFINNDYISSKVVSQANNSCVKAFFNKSRETKIQFLASTSTLKLCMTVTNFSKLNCVPRHDLSILVTKT